MIPWLSTLLAPTPAESPSPAPLTSFVSEGSLCSRWNKALNGPDAEEHVDFCVDRKGVGVLASEPAWAAYGAMNRWCRADELRPAEDGPPGWVKDGLELGYVAGVPGNFRNWGCWPEVAWLPDVQCSAVLVAPMVLLTARHCADAQRAEFDLPRKYDADAPPSGAPARWKTDVIDVIPHRSLDLALLLLRDDPGIAPARWAGAVGADWRDAPLVPVGFGKQDQEGDGLGTRAATLLKRVDAWGAPPPAPCGAEPDREPTCRTDHEFVAESMLSEPLDTAPGDSGGPIFAQVPSGSSLQTRWLLVGIASRGRSDRATQFGEGGVYVRPDTTLDWILPSIDRLHRTWLRTETE